jgi:competence protein ComGF
VIGYTSRYAKAFTLLEVMLAVVLSTIILLVATKVLQSLLQIQKRESSFGGVGVSDILADQIRRDVSNATNISIGQDQFRLTGMLATDRTSMSANLRFANVVYRIRRQGDESLFERVEVNAQGQTMIDPLWLDVATIRVATTYMDLNQQMRTNPIGNDAELLGNISRGASQFPPSIRITIGSTSGRSLFDEVVFHHWESDE